MAITKNKGRQGVLSAYQDFTYADIASGVAAEAIDLPAGAQVVGGDLTVDTAWNSATSDALVVGDGLVANRYLASTSIAAAACTALTKTGYRTPSTSNKVRVTWTGVGAAPSAGAARLRVDYIVNKRATTSQG